MKKICCEHCGRLYKFTGQLPKGKTAICAQGCKSKFKVGEPVEAPAGGQYAFIQIEPVRGQQTECVGAKYHMREFRKLIREWKQDPMEEFSLRDWDEGQEIPVACWLIPETDNQHDENAVRVEVDGFKLGYLSREHAKRHRNYLTDSGRPLWRLTVPGFIQLEFDMDNKLDGFALTVQCSWSDG